MIKKILFSKPFIGKYEKIFVNRVFDNKKFTDGEFQNKAKNVIGSMIKSKCLELTHSCSSALEISMLLIDLKKGDEVIMPSYTFTSTANAVLLRGGKPVFVDVSPHDVNLNYKLVEKKINQKTKAIIVVHYAGIACDMNNFLKLKKKHKIFLIEDAAHAFLGKFDNKFLGTIGDFGAFSFHETKNFIGGQCGALSINDPKYIKKAQIILDKGTDRSFVDNKKKYYSWKGIGSEYRATELSSALLCGQLKNYKKILSSRKLIWNKYSKELSQIKSDKFYLLQNHNFLKKNAYHVFALIFNSLKYRDKYIKFMKKNNIDCYFHYYPLHMSKFGKIFKSHDLSVSEKIYNGLVRLPLYPSLKKSELNRIILTSKKFLKLI
tara:strand:- start:378 stop:1508 length:1131 start_codon:yes stop_codon:yes gene_type:complete